MLRVFFMSKAIEDNGTEIITVRAVVENCIQNHGTPTIILGSGASAAHGLQTMGALAEELIEIIDEDTTVNKHDDWDKFKEELKSTKNLERSLEVIEENSDLIDVITEVTWKLISRSDEQVFLNLLNGKDYLHLSSIITSLSSGTNPDNNLVVITTNYDRLAEYACDFADDDYNEYIHYTGFSYGLIRRQDKQFNTIPTIRSRRVLYNNAGGYSAKIIPIEILKVHGSIDWYETNSGQTRAVANHHCKPESCKPAIITPGKTKFFKTHLSPYSEVVARAKQVLEHSKNYLVIGFGFRDEHIHTNLARQIRTDGRKNFIVLARTLTEETKSLFFGENKIESFVLMERAEDQKTRIYLKSRAEELKEYLLDDQELWSLHDFCKFFLRG